MGRTLRGGCARRASSAANALRIEVRVGCVALGDHDRCGDRPADAKGRIVPANPGGELRCMRHRHLIQHLGILAQRLEAVGDAGRDDRPRRGCPRRAPPRSAGGRSAAPGRRSSSTSMDRPAQAAHQLALLARAATASACRAPCRAGNSGRCWTARSATAGRAARNSSRAHRAREEASGVRVTLHPDKRSTLKFERFKLHVSARRTRRRSGGSTAGTSAASGA